jgi:hypothetical protein
MARTKGSEVKVTASAKTSGGATRAKPAQTNQKPKRVAKATKASGASILRLANAVSSSPQLETEEVARRAYFHWLARGCPEGSPDQDWFRAEEEILASSK